MRRLRNQLGVSSMSIILLGLLALSVVLLDGIAISVNQKNARIQKNALQEKIYSAYCFNDSIYYPPGCNITKINKCDNHFVLSSDCLGVGNIVVNNDGKVVVWCGYTSFDSKPAPDCGKYQVDAQGNNCLLTKNLCSKQ